MNGMDAKRLKGLLRALDKTHRLILLLFYVDELTALEISIVMNIPEPKVHDVIDSVRDRAREVVELKETPAGALEPASMN